MNLMITVVAFVVALGLLIVVHELGHYWVARWCGVKVLRFSVGFGRPVFLRRLGPDRTEWAVTAVPLGGYVKMLDEREGDVLPHERQRAFNRQPVGKRFAIVAAGPVANFVLAIAVYWLLFVHGVPGLKPILGAPPPGSPAAQAQIAAGDTIVAVDDQGVATWQDVRWVLLERAVARQTVTLEVRDAQARAAFRRVDLSSLTADDLDSDFLSKVGLTRLPPPPVVGEAAPGKPGARAGLQPGDRITAVDGKPIASWDDLVAAVTAMPGTSITLEVERAGRPLELRVTPDSVTDAGRVIGRIWVSPDRAALERQIVDVRYGPLAALGQAALRTWEVSLLSLRMLGKMIVGDVSLKNLSGPITIADYAGQSAQMGWVAYAGFIALISISLGVLNLLPVPLLDGGHLMYYLIEVVKGSPVSERALEIGQRIGMFVLFTLMAFALYNDIHRLVGG